MAEPESMILPLLREIRAEMNSKFGEVGKRFDGVDQRLERMEQRMENIRQAAIGDPSSAAMPRQKSRSAWKPSRSD